MREYMSILKEMSKEKKKNNNKKYNSGNVYDAKRGKKNENRKFLKSRNVIIEMCERKKKVVGVLILNF